MSAAVSIPPALPSTLPAPPFMRRCSCCGAHIRADEWFFMPYIGHQEDGNGGYLELRNHGCGSTLALEVEGFRFGGDE